MKMRIEHSHSQGHRQKVGGNSGGIGRRISADDKDANNPARKQTGDEGHQNEKSTEIGFGNVIA